MPAGDRPDLEALKELEDVLRHLESELAGWRRRALGAEARLADAGGGSDHSARARELEDENKTLQQRLTSARGRLTELLERLRFLEQQQDNGDAA